MGQLIHMQEPRNASHTCIAYGALCLDEYKMRYQWMDDYFYMRVDNPSNLMAFT